MSDEAPSHDDATRSALVAVDAAGAEV